MDILLYFHQPTRAALGDLEDDLDAALTGLGEVTGSGAGAAGTNIDIRITREADVEEALRRVRACLRDRGLDDSARIERRR